MAAASYVWQAYDLFPEFPELQRFLAFWQEKLEGPLHSVQVAHLQADQAGRVEGDQRRVPAALNGGRARTQVAQILRHTSCRA